MPPGTNITNNEIIRVTVLRKLYLKQEKYWRTELKGIVLCNARYHNRTAEKFGIHYLGKNWYPGRHLDQAFDEAYHDVQYLTLHPGYIQHAPEIEKKLLSICNELAQLELEEYECGRFLSGLVLFPAPLDVFEQILGQEIFEECKRELAQQLNNAPNYSWDANAQAALTTYVAHHDYILKAMRQRLLMNMITRDQIRQ
jgi:hypothetical protein